MQVPVMTLVAEFARQAELPQAMGKDELYLRTLVAEFASNAAMVKRDMRRLLEGDPQSFLKAACNHGTGAAYLADLLCSSARLFAALADLEWMLAPAIALAQRWVR